MLLFYQYPFPRHMTGGRSRGGGAGGGGAPGIGTYLKAISPNHLFL